MNIHQPTLERAPVKYAVRHWHLFCVATTWWTLYFIVGLPWDYFQQTPSWALWIFGVLVPTVLYWRFALRRAAKKIAGAVATLVWMAFYFTVPLLVYDYLYLAVHQSRGWSFLVSHWYLTIFYVIPWAVVPLANWRAQKMVRLTQ